MATKGVLIDITKPENYITRQGEGVVYLAERRDEDYQIFAVIRDEDGKLFSQEYTEDGFFYEHKGINNEDLILRQELQSSQIKLPEMQPETKKRKVVQLSNSVATNDRFRLVLCDDGSIFRYDFANSSWTKLPPIPQD